MFVKRHKPRPQVAACAFEVRTDGNETQLLPAGEFRARDGRPTDADAWRLTAEITAGVIARANARQNAIVIDYEHQTLRTEVNGKPAPAAGWFTSMAFREGEGLFATDTTWTERAQEMIRSGEYRYISAVFSYRPDSGEVLEILHAGLTNFPALDGLAEVSAQAAARFSPYCDESEEDAVPEALLKLLGLTKDASEEDVSKAVEALKAQADQVPKLREALGVDENADLDQAVADLKGRQGESGEPDPSKYVPVTVVEELRGEIAELRGHQVDSEVDTLVKTALNDGRLLPPQEEWARKLGKKDVAALRGYLETAQPIAALKGQQSGGQAPDDGGDSKLTATQRAVCRSMGLSEEEYLKGLEQDGGAE